jgi:hypothetical protein
MDRTMFARVRDEEQEQDAHGMSKRRMTTG